MYTNVPSYLLHEGRSIYFRMAVPKSLRHLFNKREIKFSLGACVGLNEARSKAIRLASLLKRLIDSLKRRLRLNMPIEMSPEQIQTLVDEFAIKALDDFEDLRLKWGKLTPEFHRDHTRTLENFHRLTVNKTKENHLGFVASDVDNFLEERGITPEKDAVWYKRLSRSLLVAFQEVLDVEIKRNAGDYSQEYKRKAPAPSSHPMGSTTHPVPTPSQQAPSPRLKTLMIKYEQEKQNAGRWTEQTRLEIISAFDLFLEWAGEDITADQINHPLMTKYGEMLSLLPSRRNTRKPYKGKPLAEILKMDIPKEERQAHTTIVKGMGFISNFFKYVVKHGHMETNYAEGKTPEAPKRTKRTDEEVAAFTSDDLKRLFHSPEYTDDTHAKSFHYWIPIIAPVHGDEAE